MILDVHERSKNIVQNNSILYLQQNSASVFKFRIKKILKKKKDVIK